MTAIPICVSTRHTELQAGLILRGLMRPEDAAEQACFSKLAAEGRDSEVRAALRRAEQAARLHIANREWAIREQAI